MIAYWFTSPIQNYGSNNMNNRKEQNLELNQWKIESLESYVSANYNTHN